MLKLITGGAKGIGKKISFDFAKSGYNVCINYNKSESEAILLKEELANEGCSVVICKADITKNEEVHKMVNDVIKTFGKIDVLVNNSGVCDYNLFTDISNEKIRCKYLWHYKCYKRGFKTVNDKKSRR